MSDLKDKIKDLKKHNTNKDVLNILRGQGYKVSLSTIEKTKIDDRILELKCQNCGKIFYFDKYKKYCVECSGYFYNDRKKEIAKQMKMKERQDLENMMLETIRITGLDRKKIRKLLSAFTHSEIRKSYAKSN